MAPKKGGGGGGGYSSSSSSCNSQSDYPCTDGLFKMYGKAAGSFYSEQDLHGQVVLYAIWTVALLIILTQTLKTKARALQLALVLFSISFIFLCVRYGLIISESDVPIGYRFESSVVNLLQRLGMIVLIAGVFPPEASKLFKFAFYPLLGVYGALNITYIIYDFILSSKAIEQFKDDWSWRYSDRDFGLTLTPDAIHTGLIYNGDTKLSPTFALSRMFDTSGEENWQTMRDVQVKIGVAADALALVLAIFIAAVAALIAIKRKHGTFRLIVAAVGLLFTSLFRFVVAAHFVLWNWKIVTDPYRWFEWIDTYDYDPNTFLYSGGNEDFLSGYRPTNDVFPILQAMLEPLGIVIAAAGMMVWWRGQHKYNTPVAGAHQDDQWKEAPPQNPGLTDQNGQHYNQHFNQHYNQTYNQHQ